MKRVIICLLACSLLGGLIPLCASTISAEPGVSAQAAALMELSSQTLLMDINARQRLPMASTTKIMTALVALEECEDLSKEICVSADAIGIEGSSVYLKAGEPLSMEQLLYALLLESANDAAAAVAIEIAGSIPAFAEKMNETAARIGLQDTHFTNPHGLDDPEHYTTAYDLALLSCYALSNPDFVRIASTYKTTIPMYDGEGMRVLVNHNRMLKSYDGAIGVKTGYTKRCGRCLVSAAERNGVTMVAVTLSDPDDWQDHAAMLDFGFSQYASLSLLQAGEFRCVFPCLGGEQETVCAVNRDALQITLPIQHGEITMTTDANRYLCAPIDAGEEVGALLFHCDGRLLARVPLYAETRIDALLCKRSLTDRLKDLLRIS